VTERPECAQTRALVPELALGVASGDERAVALAHLSGCADCRRELAGTTEIVDGLLLLAPEKEPPAGFESAVLARIAPTGGTDAPGPAEAAPPAPRRRRGRLALLCTALAVAAACLAAGTVWRMTADDRHLAAAYRQTLHIAHGRQLRAAPLVAADGTESGTLFAYQGHPSWVYVTFRSPPARGTYTVHLLADNRCYPLRPYQARPGGLAWGSTIAVSVHDIVLVQFIRADNPVLTARFSGTGHGS
jgi:Putative zinc-finger